MVEIWIITKFCTAVLQERPLLRIVKLSILLNVVRSVFKELDQLL